MTTPTTEQTVIAAIATISGTKREDIRLDDTFERLHMDSLDIVETAMALEDEMAICIDDDDLAEVDTVGGLIALVERIRSGAQQETT